MGGSIVLLTLIVVAVFLSIINSSSNQALVETVNTVRNTFTATIEEMEPGKFVDNINVDESSNTVLAQNPENN